MGLGPLRLKGGGDKDESDAAVKIQRAWRARGDGEDEEFETGICHKCDKEFEKDDTGEWGCTNIRMSSGRLEGIVFCHDCWEDEVDNCETDEEGDSVWKGE